MASQCIPRLQYNKSPSVPSTSAFWYFEFLVQHSKPQLHIKQQLRGRQHRPGCPAASFDKMSGQAPTTRTAGGNSAFHNFNNDFAHIQNPNERRRLALAEIDKAPFGWYHVRACVVAGMGFFVDSYDVGCNYTNKHTKSFF